MIVYKKYCDLFQNENYVKELKGKFKVEQKINWLEKIFNF